MVGWERELRVVEDGLVVRGVWSRMTRRRLLGGAAAGGATLAALAAGCGSRTGGGSSSKSGASGAAGKPQRGGTIQLSENFQRGFDPHILQATDTGTFGLFYSTLIRANPTTFEIEPDLAAKWEVPSPTELVFTLAPNIKWQDRAPANGRPLKVDDIIYSYKRIQTSDPKFINKGYLSSVDKMEAVDSSTLKITLKSPDVTQLGNLAVFSMKILNPETVDKAGDKFATADTVVGTGAFVLQSTELNVGSTLVRNPNYFKLGLPYLDGINLKAFGAGTTDFEAEWAAFLAGQLDYRWVPGQDSQKFEADKKNQYTMGWVGDQIYFITQAQTQKKPWDDTRLQRAMKLLIDHKEFRDHWATTWFGRGRYSAVFGTATADVWDLTEDEYGKYLEFRYPKDDANKEAIQLLSAAGYTKDKPLKFVLAGTNGNGYQAEMVQLAQAQYKQGSQGALDPDIKLFGTAEWASTRAQGNFEYYIGGHSSGGLDPDTYFSSTYHSGGGRNYGHMSDPKLDAMLDNQRTIFDEKQRKQAVREIIMYMLDNCPYGTAVPNYILYATPPRINGFPPQGPTFKWGDHYENVWVTR
jgi:peptide/nickel transport system substrate-binding protein